MFCEQCGTQLPNDAVFCTGCGAKMAPTEAAKPVEAVSSVQAIPVQAVPVQEVQAVPVQAVPVQAVPVQAVPVQTVPVQAVPVQATPVQSVYSAPPVNAVPPVQAYNPPPVQTPYQPNVPSTPQVPLSDLTKPMSVGAWLVTFLIMWIPIVNFVMIFVWAFGSNVNKSKQNLFRASLILMVISIILSIVFAATLVPLITSTFESMSY